MFIVFVAFLMPILVTPGSSAELPKWVHRVDSCPDPGNISQWMEASKNLNCYHNLTSNDPNEQEKVYHCLPSSFLNETVEFCGRNVPIGPGKCPVYNYEVSQNMAPTSYNCSTFSSGCPEKQYFSKDVYNYAECLSLNRQERCFIADSNCKNISKDEIPRADAHGFKKDPLTSVEMSLIGSSILASTLFLLLLILTICFLKRWKRMGKGEKHKDVISEHELEALDADDNDSLIDSICVRYEETEEKLIYQEHDGENMDGAEEATLNTEEPVNINDEGTEEDSAKQIDGSKSDTSLMPTPEMIKKSPKKYSPEIQKKCKCKHCKQCVGNLKPQSENTSGILAEKDIKKL